MHILFSFKYNIDDMKRIYSCDSTAHNDEYLSAWTVRM